MCVPPLVLASLLPLLLWTITLSSLIFFADSKLTTLLLHRLSLLSPGLFLFLSTSLCHVVFHVGSTALYSYFFICYYRWEHCGTI